MYSFNSHIRSNPYIICIEYLIKYASIIDRKIFLSQLQLKNRNNEIASIINFYPIPIFVVRRFFKSNYNVDYAEETRTLFPRF